MRALLLSRTIGSRLFADAALRGYGVPPFMHQMQVLYALLAAVGVTGVAGAAVYCWQASYGRQPVQALQPQPAAQARLRHHNRLYIQRPQTAHQDTGKSVSNRSSSSVRVETNAGATDSSRTNVTVNGRALPVPANGSFNQSANVSNNSSSVTIIHHASSDGSSTSLTVNETIIQNGEGE